MIATNKPRIDREVFDSVEEEDEEEDKEEDE